MGRHANPDTQLEAEKRSRGTKPGRITALDVARGAFLVMSVSSVAFLAPRPAPLIHAPWIGVRYVDLIFPMFVSLSGIGLAFAYRNHSPLKVTMRRVVVLCLAGLTYNAVIQGTWRWSELEVTGPLQMYAALVAVISSLHLVLRSWRAWAVMTLGAALLSAVAFAWYSSTCPGLMVSPTCNPSGAIDSAIFGPGMYLGGQAGHDPSGVVAIGGAFLTAAAGTTAGHLALAARGGELHLAPRRLLVWATTVFLAGWALTPLVPAFKRLWTPSFGLMAAALGVVVFAVAFQLFDVPAEKGWTNARKRIGSPFVAQGRNALLVYFGSHILVILLARDGAPDSLAHRLQDFLSLGTGMRWGFILANVALWWILSIFLHRRKIYIHA